MIDDDVLAALVGRVSDLVYASPADPSVARVAAAALRRALRRYASRTDEGRPTPGRRAVTRARAFLHEPAAARASLSDLAERAGMSRFHLCRQFGDEVGMPPHAYLEHVRVARAKDLLHAGRPLTEIAFRLGYADQSHFTRAFRRSAAVTPGVYGRMVRMGAQPED